jgi:ketosteroid isomerase-like protein
MARSNTIVCVVSLLLVSAVRLGHAQSETNATSAQVKEADADKKCAVVVNHNVELMLEIFRAIEQRDEQRLRELFDPALEMHWPPSLPYGGTHTASTPGPTTWAQTWIPLQPTEAERRMDPRVIAAAGDEVVVLWRQRGMAPAGERFDGEVLALYKLRNGKLVRAQMFYFDTLGAADFLAKAKAETQKK